MATTITESNVEATLARLPVKGTGALTQVGTNFTLYGQGGSGKTTLPCELHNSEFGPEIYLAAESGLLSIQHKNIPYVDITRWTDLEGSLAAYKASTPPPYKTVVIDNLSEILDKCIHHVAPSGQPSQPEWNRITNLMLDMVRGWRDLTKFMDLNVFFIAWDADEKDDAGMVKKDINFTPALRKAFPGIVDTVGWISTLDRRPDMRKLSFAPSPRTIAKFRRAPTSNARKIPFEIFYTLDNLPMLDILRTMKNDEEWPSAKYPIPTSNASS